MKKKIFSFLTILLINSISVFSQGVQIDTANSKIIDLNEVVISVNKTEESKLSVAQQTRILTVKEIINSQSQTSADLLANKGEVFVQKSQMGGGSPVIRGFEANRILLVVDGVRMNNLIYRGGHLQNLITLDNSILSRVEILYGPASTIYGSDALGGVVHLYTQRLIYSTEENNNFNVNAFSRYGSVNNEITGHADFNIGSKNFASLTSFTYSNFDDLRGGENQNPFYKHSFGERPFYSERINGEDSLVANSDKFVQVQSGYSQFDILQKFGFKQNNYSEHGLNFQYSNSSDVPRYDRLTDPDGAGLRYSEWYYGPQERMLIAYDYNINKPNSKFDNIHAGINYQLVEESRHTRRFGKDNLQHRNEKVNVVGANLDFKKVSGQNNIRFGLDGQYNTLKSTANEEDIVSGISSPLDTRYPDGDNTMLNAAVYISHSWKINDKFLLTDGLRFGYSTLHSTFVDTSFFDFPFSSVEQDNLVYSGSAGLIHTPDDTWKLSMLLSTGFRTPNIDDLSKVFESEAGSLIVPNPDLKPEQTINAELGITKIFNRRISWENVGYYTWFLDAILTDKFQYNGQDSILYDGTMSQVYANQNKQEAYIAGFSSDIKAQCSQNLYVEFGLNYTYARIKTDTSDYPLGHIPPFMMHLRLNYTKGKFGSDLSLNYNGWKKLKDYNLNSEDNEQYATSEGMPAWYSVGIRISYQIHKLINVNGGIENILDTQYRTFSSGINAPGRNYFLGVRFRY